MVVGYKHSRNIWLSAVCGLTEVMDQLIDIRASCPALSSSSALCCNHRPCCSSRKRGRQTDISVMHVSTLNTASITYVLPVMR